MLGMWYFSRKKEKLKKMKIYAGFYVGSSIFFVCFLFLFIIYPSIKNALAASVGAGITICISDNIQPACYSADFAMPAISWNTSYTSNENNDGDGACNPAAIPPATGPGVPCFDGPYNKSFVAGAVTFAGNWVSGASGGAFVAPYAWSIPTATLVGYSFSATDALGNNLIASGNFVTAPMCAPAAPSNVVITEISCRQIRVTWDDNSISPNPVEAFFDVRITRTNPDGVAIYSAGANSTSYIDSSGFVLDGATYSAEVSARNKDGISSAWVSSVTDITIAMCVPTITSVLSSDCNSVTVNWVDESNDEDGYRIYFDDLDDAANQNDGFNEDVPGNAEGIRGGILSYTFDKTTIPNGVPDGVNWEISIRSFKGGDFSDLSATFPITTVLCVPGLLSSEVLPQCGRIRTQGVDPSPHDNQDEFRIYFIDRDPGLNGNEVAFLLDVDLGILVNYDEFNNINNPKTTGIPDGVRWETYIVAYNSVVGESDPSPSLFPVVPLCDPKSVNVVTGPGCNDVRVSWSDESLNEDSFEIRLTDVNTGSVYMRSIPTDGDNERGDIDNIVILDALDGVNWSIDVRAVNLVPDGASPSNPAPPDTGTTMLCAPTNLNAVTGACSNILGWLINLRWDDHSSNESGYEIWRDPDTGVWVIDPDSPTNLVSGGNLLIPNPGSGSWMVRMPYSIDSYRYRVRAINPFVAPSAFSNIELKRTYFCNPEIDPINIYNCDFVTIVWDVLGDDSEVDGYRIYRTVSDNPYGPVPGRELIAVVIEPKNGLPESYTDYNIISAVASYTYEVEAYCSSLNCTDYKEPLPGPENMDIVLMSFKIPVLTLPCGKLPTKWWEAR